MKVTRFGPDGLPLPLAGWSTGVTSVNSNFNTEDGGLSALHFVQQIQADGSPVLNPIVNFASGSNITLSIDRGPLNSTPSNTIRISATGGGSVSYGSNSTTVAEISSAGAATEVSRFDHYHAGIGTITSSSSNTMQRGTWNIRPGSGIALTVTDTDGDGEFDTTTISSTVAAGAGGIATLRVPMLLQSVKSSADTPDDDFDGTSLDGKWTVVDGSAGTVAMLAGSGAGVYQVGARPGWITFQVGTASGDSVELRQDYTLPDGKGITAYLSYALDNSAAVSGNNEIWLGIGCNDNDAGVFSATSGQTANALFDADANGASRIIGLSATTPTFIGSNITAGNILQTGAFLRIDRTGLNYDLWYSVDGFGWNYIGQKAMATAANNVWLFAQCQASMGVRMLVHCAWFRQGTALAIDPWPL